MCHLFIVEFLAARRENVTIIYRIILDLTRADSGYKGLELALRCLFVAAK